MTVVFEGDNAIAYLNDKREPVEKKDATMARVVNMETGEVNYLDLTAEVKDNEQDEDQDEEGEEEDDVDAVMDLGTISAQLDAMEDETVRALETALAASRETLLRLLTRDFDPLTTTIKWVTTLQLNKFGTFSSELADAMRRAAEIGAATAGREVESVTRHASSVTATPKAAIRAMAEKAFWVTGVLKQRLLDSIQAVLISSIKNGEPLAETVRKVAEIWDAHPDRLRTIVRTNIIDAYNTGRLAKFRDPDLRGLLDAVRYSAVLDDRTTEICDELHGSLFHPDDPLLDRVVPPNHFNCRSLLVPVMAGTRKITKADFATKESVGRALDLMDKGFGGDK